MNLNFFLSFVSPFRPGVGIFILCFSSFFSSSFRVCFVLFVFVLWWGGGGLCQFVPSGSDDFCLSVLSARSSFIRSTHLHDFDSIIVMSSFQFKICFYNKAKILRKHDNRNQILNTRYTQI